MSVISKRCSVAVLLFAPLLGADSVLAQIRITEYMYKGVDEEFVELTNVGDQSFDLEGWSFADNGNVPGTFDLSSFGVVEAGESVLIVEHPIAAFRSAWGLCDGAKVMVKTDPSLGRSDQINIYDAGGALVDRLTYGDLDFLGSFRTDGTSAWVPLAGHSRAVEEVLPGVHAWV